MGSSTPNKVYDSLRQKWVKGTPEEIIRQRLCSKLIDELGYPKSLIVVEKKLSQMPHFIFDKNVTSRRFDIVCFAKDIIQGHSLYPLLLIECKQTPLDQNVKDQVIGYNHFLKACFVAIANETEVQTAACSSDGYHFQPYLPSFEELIACLTKT